MDNSSLQKMENILKIVVENYKNKGDVANATPSGGSSSLFPITRSILVAFAT